MNSPIGGGQGFAINSFIAKLVKSRLLMRISTPLPRAASWRAGPLLNTPYEIGQHTSVEELGGWSPFSIRPIKRCCVGLRVQHKAQHSRGGRPLWRLRASSARRSSRLPTCRSKSANDHDCLNKRNSPRKSPGEGGGGGGGCSRGPTRRVRAGADALKRARVNWKSEGRIVHLPFIAHLSAGRQIWWAQRPNDGLCAHQIRSQIM